ncbi:11769_t:CDS:2, partial [Scutellospora calospora]
MAFKGTTTHTSEQTQTILESLGGNIMCASSREAIMYQSAIFSQDLPKIISFFADVIRNPLIDPEEVAEQRQTALYEIQEIWQKPEMIMPELLHIVAYKNNTLGNPMLCPEERLSIITPELIKDYMLTWYRPERIVVAAAGAKHEEVVELVNKHFGDIPKSPDFNSHFLLPHSVTSSNYKQSKSSLYKTITTAASSILHPKQPTTSNIATQKSHYTGGTLLLDKSQPHTHLYISFEGLSIYDPDIYALAILQMLLGGGGSFSAGGPGKGMYTRLFTNVLNQYSWVESCMCFNHCYTDSGLFGIMASCRPEYNRALVDVIAKQFESVTSYGREGVTQVELARAKNQLKSSILMNLESRMVQLEDLGRQVQVHGFKIPVEVMCKKIDDVTLDDLVRVARKIIRGHVVNEGKGTGQVTVVAQGDLNGLPDVAKICEGYGLGKHGDKDNLKTVSYTVLDLLPKISSLVDTCDYQLALQFAKRALNMESDNIKVLEILGMVEIELGMFDEAKEHFLKAISINPNQGYSKYMYMGQLCEGLEAIQNFQCGVNLMIDEHKSIISNKSSSPTTISLQDSQESLNRKISTALCSMIEIYLTDCCFESDAELKCDEYLNKALEIDSMNPEVYQLLASVRLSQQKNEEAKIALEKSLNLWINLEPGDPLIPSYDIRISLVKLLLELSQYNKALAVLEILQKEDDQIVDIWYLYGWCYYCMGQDSLQNKEDYLAHWEDARDCLITCEKLYRKTESDDEGILQHTQEILQTINCHVKPVST